MHFDHYRHEDDETYEPREACADLRCVLEKLNDILDGDGRHPMAVDRLAREVNMSVGYLRVVLCGLHGAGKVLCQASIGNCLISWNGEPHKIDYVTLCREN